jgi:hypothetical protein
VEARTLVAAAFAQLHREESAGQEPMLLLEARLEQLASSTGSGSLAERLGLLTARAPVIVTDHRELHPLVEYLRRHTSGCIRIVTDVATFARLLSGTYATLPGTLLESLGKLLVENVRLYIYPVPRESFPPMREARVGASRSGTRVTLDDLRCEPPLDHLLRYLRGAGWLVPLELP